MSFCPNLLLIFLFELLAASTFLIFPDSGVFKINSASPFVNSGVAVAIIHYDIGINHEIGLQNQFQLIDDEIFFQSAQRIEKSRFTELQIILELGFFDFVASDAVLRLMKGYIEENFDDIRVWSVVDSSKRANVVENHFKTPPRVIIA